MTAPRPPFFLFCSLCATSFLGCGNPGPPLPPSLMLPAPVADLHAERQAATVALRWTMPSRSTDRVPLRGPQRALVCRAFAQEACAEVGAVSFPPGAAAEYRDQLPAILQTGPPKLLEYQVRVANRHGRGAEASKEVVVAAGAAPPQVLQAKAETTAKGVRVTWDAPAWPAPARSEGAKLLVRMERQELPGPQTASAKSTTQTLEAPEELRTEAGGNLAWVPTSILDPRAALNHTYRYTVMLVERSELEGQPLELRGSSATTPVLDARDVFPPATPSGLVTVANPEGKTVDLSWQEDDEHDLAGYFVYRRPVDSTTPPVRVSGRTPLAAPGWSDPNATPGTRYAYSVSARDTSGNESARSPESVEELPEP